MPSSQSLMTVIYAPVVVYLGALSPKLDGCAGHTSEEAHILEFIATGEAAGYASASEAAASERRTLKISNAVLMQAIQESPHPQKHFTHAEDIALARAVLAGGIAVLYVHDG